MSQVSECYDCQYKQNIPGNCHIKCVNPDPEMTGKTYGMLNGWFNYPFCFDPVWKTKNCANFKEKEL